MTNQELYDLAVTKQPLSVIRCGDGEAMLLSGNVERIKWLMRRQLGYVPANTENIRLNLIEAYKDADILGLPENKRPGLNEYWNNCYELLSSAIGEDIMTSKRISSNDFHNDWLTDGYFDKLLSGLDTLCYISCRNLDDRFREVYGIKNVYSYIIAPEMRFALAYSGKPHWPDQLNEIKKWINTIPAAGSLCLVGAGVVGKIYCNWFRDKGGIALDIGNVFDLWAGLKTRGVNRGIGVTDETYKL